MCIQKSMRERENNEEIRKREGVEKNEKSGKIRNEEVKKKYLE